MGWKIVRDRQRQWVEKRGVSGQWRICETPVESLTKKLLEEIGELIEAYNPAELYDIQDVLDELFIELDPCGRAGAGHLRKVQELGRFAQRIEWTPTPAEYERDNT
jgi:predicted house-cleaning noncanonical NTP pyrophosphatase (MazG superfamily)